MLYNKFNLFLTAVLAILLFFVLPANNGWLYQKVLNSNVTFTDQVQHLSTLERNQSRFGKSYDFYLLTAKKLAPAPNVLLMLPPNDYLKKVNVAEIEMPEPAIFYYFTGLSAVTTASDEVLRANWALVPMNGTIALRKIKNRQQLDSLIALYKQYTN